jgi:hypothetical protein
MDRASDLSPVDFLLTWGPLVEEPNRSGIEWVQTNRWGIFRYRFEDVNVDQATIESHEANTHVVPEFGNSRLRSRLLDVDPGDVVRLRGQLIDVHGDDGWSWNTSRSSEDTGDGSCEILYVRSLDVRRR